MPALNIERTRLPQEMHDALKRHILRERQRKKDEADANEADKQRRRAEKVSANVVLSRRFSRRRNVHEKRIINLRDVFHLGSSTVFVESSVGRQRQRYSRVGTNASRSRTAEI